MANSLILTKAQNAITAHDWATAARYYKELLRGNESNVEYLQQLGSIYVRDGQDEKAIPYYEQIITFHPENTNAMVSLGAIFRRLKRYEDSVNILHKAQEISSDNPNINYNLGFTYKEMGDYDDAIDSFESVIARNPDDVLAHNHLGSIYFSKKEHEKAISAYKRGLQVDQNHPILNYNLAHVYEAIKNYPESVRCYEIALKTRPGWLDAIRDFSELLIRCQETKQAQELVEQSIKLHPDDVELLCILGRIYLNQFDYDNATKTFKRAETLKQNDIGILVGLSKSLEKGMKIEQAMDKILDAVDVAPENIDVCKQYAHVLLSAQRYDKALDLIKTIDEKSDGKDLQILDLYGQYFVCRGDEEAANTYYDKIRKINHHYKDYMINAADRYIQTGNYEKAEEMADKFVASRPALPDGYNLLGTINSARGELNKAKAEYEKGIGLKNPNIYAVKALEKINSELEANKELYNDGENPIEVDADKLSEEEGGNIADDSALNSDEDQLADQLDALNANGDEEEDDSVLHGLESTPPIEQALTGEDGDFWEDFDDDPNAEPKTIDEEEDAYDENEENSDLLTMMTPAAAEGDESLKDGLAEDSGDFDFSDFDNAAATAEPEEAAPGQATPAQASQEADYEPEDFATEPEDFAAEPEPAPAAKPAPQPMEDPETLSKAQQLMDDLKQQQKEMEEQQKELEFQQREFALQQKELAEELKQKNEEMIQEAVDKAVDKAVGDMVDEAVEEKLSGYDLQPASEAEPEVVPEPVIEEPATEPAAEEIPSDDFDLQLYDEEFGDTDFTEDDDIASSESEEILSEEAALDGFDSGMELEMETETESKIEAVAEPEAEPEAESEAEEEIEAEVPVEEEIAEEEIPEEEVVEEEVIAAEPEVEAEPEADFVPEAEAEIEEELTSEPFVTVEEIYELSDSEAQTEPEAPLAAESVEVEEEELDDESFVTADDMVDKIGRILNDNDTAKNYASELELFKKLRTLSSFLPEKDKNSYDCCRMRMVIEYIIQKMSGKPGLLITAESLIKSGVLGEEYNRQLEDCCEEDLSNDLIRHVISDMKKLAQGLEDEYLCKALCVSADAILEQIALLDQKVSIF